MQGRLSPQVDGKIQAFPFSCWQGEFASAERSGFSLMEWTLDQDNLYANPLLTTAGQNEIRKLCESHGIMISSLTGDCFMQSPFWKTQGAVRDSLEIEEMGFPVFSCGTNPNGPTKVAPGRIGHPVSVGGVTVHPGDLVLGDADGVVIVERQRLAALLPLASKKVKDEAARIAAIQQGDTAAKWLDAALRTAGVLKEGEHL